MAAINMEPSAARRAGGSDRPLEGRRVLAFIFQRVTPPENGLHVAVWNRLESLAALGAEVHLLSPQAWRPRTGHWPESSRKATAARGVHLHLAPAHLGTLDFWWAAAWQVFVKRLGRVVWPRPDSVYYWRPQLMRQWSRMLGSGRFDLAWVNYATWSRLLPRAGAAGCTTVLETHEFLSRQYEVRLRLNGRPPATPAESAAYLRAELEAVGRADLVLTLNHEEAATFRSHGIRQAECIPVSVPRPVAASQPESTDFLAVGSHIESNRRGLSDFLTGAWPKILAARPEARLTVCGGVGEALTGAERNVTWVKFAPSLSPHYLGAKVVLLTTVAGAGIKIKAIEAMAHGCCILAHAHSVAALPFESGNHGEAVADLGQAAPAALALLDDAPRRARLGASAQRLFEEEFSPEAIQRLLGATLTRVLAERRAAGTSQRMAAGGRAPG